MDELNLVEVINCSTEDSIVFLGILDSSAENQEGNSQI